MFGLQEEEEEEKKNGELSFITKIYVNNEISD